MVANRGEIAVRVQQTLQVMGVETIAVYSDDDCAAPHVLMSGEAHPLPGQTPEETYLAADKIIDIARRSGAEAIHPGYGFLSENPAFAGACREAGLAFIGPTPENIAELGDKVQSKDVARRAGAPVLPSSPIGSSIDATLREFAAQWGFPLLVKAAAGGGGRGIRLANDESELPLYFDMARREAAAAFGDDRVFLEKFVSSARHVEIQVLADQAGNTLHLFERECSIQRRRQKLVEETPSPVLTTALREKMGQAAVAIARAAGYVNAGTVEFLLDPAAGQFYFLEMNTRLQVEHGITEETLGLDLVAWQTRIAAGNSLDFSQEDLRPRGHALQCRIYAEDPYRNFLPVGGPLTVWEPPSGPGLRLDSGVAPGQEISPHYDPLLAKLVAWGPDRATCLGRMERALSNFVVLGTVTNIPFLRDLIAHPRFQAGDYNTAFLEQETGLTTPPASGDTDRMAAALAAWASAQPANQSNRGLSRNSSPAPETPPDSPWRSVGSRTLP